MIRFSARPCAGAIVACAAVILATAPAAATPFTVTSGSTITTGQTLTGAETGTVESGGTLQTGGNDAIIVSGSSTGVVIDNSGTIESTGNRGIDTSGGSTTRNVTLNNNEGALLSGSSDAFRIDSDVTSGSITVNNAGTIQSTNDGQAIDFDAIESGTATVTINNLATGVIQSTDADAVRPGEGGVVNNYGTIASNSLAADPSDDGVDLQGHSATVNNFTDGSISGARHGITSDVGVTVTNAAGASITGRNGSGVGSDGTGSVTNHGTITGAVDGVAAEGDGDGVDIDFAATILNYGVIQGTGAAGTKEDEILPNSSEGIAAGGGLIENYAGALISGAHNGILIDDSNSGGAGEAVTILNAGTIQGLDGYAIRLVGDRDDEITNGGVISASNGNAVDMGGGNDRLNLQTGSAITGSIDGGAGTDGLHLSGTGSLAGSSNFETLDADGGSWTVSGTQAYADAVTVAGGAGLVADGATLETAVLQVNEGGVFDFSGAGGTIAGDVVNDGTVRVSETTATFTGSFTNNGAFISDPSTQAFGDLATGANGYIQAAAGDVYQVAGDFKNGSTRKVEWNTAEATLQFTGAPGTAHELLVAGLDLGADGFVDNFAWGALVIDAGNVLELGSGLVAPMEVALYVGELIGAEILDDAIANIVGNGVNLYYDVTKAANAYLGGLDYALAGGGQLLAATAVPEPASVAFLTTGIVLGGVMLRRRLTGQRGVCVASS